MATRPQEVSLNLANVKFFSSSKHFQIQSLKLTVWFRALKRRGRGKKKKIYKREEDTRRIIRLRQSTITSYFPRYRSNQFCPSPKNNRPVPPRSVSRRYSRREHRRVQISGTYQDSIQSRSCRTHPRIVEGKKKKEREEESWWLLRARASSPTCPFLRFTFSPRPLTFFLPSQELSFFPHPFSYPSLTFTFFCYRLHEPFERVVVDLGGGRKKSATIRIS